MTVFLIEKSIDGLYSALFYAFEQKTLPDAVFERGNICNNFTDKYIEIMTEKEKSRRVLTAIKKYGGKSAALYIEICLLSGDENALKIAFDFAYLTLSKRRDVSGFLANRAVSIFYYTIKKVFNERHRFFGLIRFKETASGVLYAAYSPDNDITELLCPHFIKRLSCVPFIIHDVKRNKAGVSNGKEYKIMETENKAALNLSEDEKAWENLWKNYYKAVNIKERKNKRQQDNLMPRRYRKFLPETYE